VRENNEKKNQREKIVTTIPIKQTTSVGVDNFNDDEQQIKYPRIE
jgi:hypothetical protein